MASVVLVEDDADIGDAIRRALIGRGHAVRLERTGLAALAGMTEGPVDIVVLDLGLPDIDGVDLLKMLRAISAVPVIVATARDDDASIVRTLDAGADDYVTKPYSCEQLDARIRAVLRRGATAMERPAIVVAGLRIDPSTHEVELDGQLIRLSRKEFELLHHLASRQGRLVTKRELLATIWGQPWGGSENTLDVHISWLRRKLGETAAEPRFLRSVRGVGIRLVDPNTPA